MKKSKNLLGKWQNWKVKHIISTKKIIKNMILPRLMFNAQSAFWQWSLYTRCRDLPLSRFIRCACDGDLKALCRFPIIPQTILRRTWAHISEEYAKLSGSPGYEKSFALSKEIAREHTKLELIKMCLRILIVKHSKESINRLRELGYTYRFDWDNPAAFRKDLERVGKSAAMIALELENKRKQYDKILSGAKPMAKNSFMQALAILSKYMGFRINPQEVTVEEYLTMQKQMNKETQAPPSFKNSKVG